MIAILLLNPAGAAVVGVVAHSCSTRCVMLLRQCMSHVCTLNAWRGLMQGDQDTAWHLNLWDAAASTVLHSTAFDSVDAAYQSLLVPCQARCAARFMRTYFDNNTDLANYDRLLKAGQMPECEGALQDVQPFDMQEAAVAAAAAAAAAERAAASASKQRPSNNNPENAKAASVVSRARTHSMGDDVAGLVATVQGSLVVRGNDQNAAGQAQPSSAKSSSRKGRQKGSTRPKGSRVDTTQLD